LRPISRQLEFAYNNGEHTSTGQTPFPITYGQHPITLDDVLLRAPPDGEDPPVVEYVLDATERARTLAREAIELMNSRMAEKSMLTDEKFNLRSRIRFSFPHRTSACQKVPSLRRSLHHGGLFHFQ
jgi:hypothetical protein